MATLDLAGVRKLIVVVLERGCHVVDRLPFALGTRTGLGCPKGLAWWASELDERWHTGVWAPPPS